MLHHIPDPTFKRIKGCLKRFQALSSSQIVGISSPSDLLRVQFSNMLFAYTESDLTENLILLDWFAQKIETHSKTHIISGDPSVHFTLNVWNYLLAQICDPSLI